MKKTFSAILLSLLMVANSTAYANSSTSTEEANPALQVEDTAASDQSDEEPDTNSQATPSESSEEEAENELEESLEIEQAQNSESESRSRKIQSPRLESNTGSQATTSESSEKESENESENELEESLEGEQTQNSENESRHRKIQSPKSSKKIFARELQGFARPIKSSRNFRWGARKDNKKVISDTKTSTSVAKQSNESIDLILNSFSTRNYKAEIVPEHMIQSILLSGQKAPSAMNLQPWHFTVIRDVETAGSLVSRDYKDGNVVIVVSGKQNESSGFNVSFDCGLAAQNMFIAAQSLGLGARMYYSGVQQINDSMKDTLEIPEDYEAVIIMLVGYMDDDTDAVSSASTRNPVSDNVNFID